VPIGANGGPPGSFHFSESAKPVGFTPGAAAAAAARAAAELLFHGQKVGTVELRSPVGVILSVPVSHVDLDESGSEPVATAGVVKRGGDLTDPTEGITICATVSRTSEQGVMVDGGPGVGRVTSPGLAVPLGKAAINPVPRQMIADALSPILPPGAGAGVIISVPGGEELAARTNMAEQGIEGGIAILGTTGIVDRERSPSHERL
ncbi:MAG: cobalt-precorrin-5B (C(1))-methyltransferase, partial [Chloroflexi bacterium]|nr:cobalt-precorrin-5B (C(1))-methyltransferase [Chloroflexota bacterium]